MEKKYPRYKIPLPILANLVIAGLFGLKRNFRTDAARMLPGITPQPVLTGKENLPACGPGVITVNHYFRSGFWTPWFPALISAAVPRDIFWTMTDAFTYPGYRFGWLYRSVSHWVLGRVAKVYSFNSMPPMPPAPGEIMERTQSVTRIMAYARKHPEALIGLAPEGGDQPGGCLHLSPPGFGKLAIALARQGMVFYPVGVYEEHGLFCIRFGNPYCLEVPDYITRVEQDLFARRIVKDAVAQCLPDWLRGNTGE
jgi:hypothetical protein